MGRYRLLGRLGSGGMGDVFLGQSPGGRLVAVKLIRADLAQNPDFRVRFAREVAAARRVGGIFTTPVVDADPDGPEPWLVTAYVDGASLAETVEAHGPLPAESVRRLAAGLAEGIAAIHAAGVVHRDLKPSNVLLAADGPRIIDFGISRALDGTGVTHSGSIIGSPGFMSPEQADGQPVGPPSDIFSLGSVLTFAATGEGPFGEGLPSVLIYRIVHAAPNTAAVPAWIRPLIEGCLAKNPAGRPSAEDVLAEVNRLAPVAAPGTTGLAHPPTVTASAGTRTTGPQPGPGDAVPGYAYPAAPSYPPARRRRKAGLVYIAVAAALVTVGLAVIAVHLATLTTVASPPAPVVHSIVPSTPTASPTSPATSATRTTKTPRSVVEAYFTAINDRDFAKAWQLGGDNLGESYHSFVAGFDNTANVTVASLRTTGDNVNVQTTATEMTGQVQHYALIYIVQGGVIVYGKTTLISTSP
ncbi:MAG TPA: protein kinase [Streptosporangiaceae bacterium]|nr:protein kinase [Streptosporangiaceae bacterium]